jgi:hypothetical protein
MDTYKNKMKRRKTSKALKGKKKYDVPTRVKMIFNAIWEMGGAYNGSSIIKSSHTGQPMSYAGVRQYLKRNGYKIVMGPYLTDLKGNVIDPDNLSSEED